MRPFRWLRASVIALGLVAWGFTLFSFGLSADTLELKDGTFVQGRITGQDRTRIFVHTKQGVRTIQKSALRRIRYDDPAVLERQAQEARVAKQAREREVSRLALARKAEEERARRANLAREASAAKEQPSKVAVKAAHRDRDAADGRIPLRSALVPGLALYSAGQKYSGVVVASAATALFVGGFQEHFRGVAARREYASRAIGLFGLPLLAGSETRLPVFAAVLGINNQNYAAFQNRLVKRDQFLLAFSILYSVQLGHALFFLKAEDDQAVRPGAGGVHWAVAYALRF